MSDDSNKCSMESCEGELGPDALVFEHNGQPAGGVCNNCLGDAKALRVLFKKTDDNQYLPVDVAHINNPF